MGHSRCNSAGVCEASDHVGRASASDGRILDILLDHLPAIVWTTDRDLCVTDCRGSQLDRRGAESETLPHGALWFGADADPEGEPASAHRRALAGEAVSYEQTRDGRTYQCHVEPVRGDNGDIEGCAGVALDVTDRLRTERQLADEHRALRTLVDTLPDFIFLKDTKSRYVLNNEAHLTLLGAARPEDVLGKTDFDFFPQQMAAAFYTDEQEMLRHPRVLDREEPVVDANGRWRWVSTIRSPLRDARGQIVGIVGTSRDITDRKLAEAERTQLLVREQAAREEAVNAEAEVRRLNAELEQRVAERTAQLEAANKELEAFAYTVSHDLRAPLRAIEGFARILTEEYSDGLAPTAQHYVNRVCENAARMTQLVDDLLGFSRLGRQSLNRRPVQTADIAREVLDELLPDPSERVLTVAIRDLPPCNGDPALIRQVFVNLLSNAIKFTRDQQNAEIEVGWTSDQSAEGQTAYYVRDNGVGFDMRYAHKLFNVFQRLHRPGDYEGTGVGLAIAHRIVTRHGGRIWAESQPGKGTTFYFTLEGPAASE